MRDAVANEAERPDIIMRLQPTSPFREFRHVNWALRLLENGAGAVIGITENPKHPLLQVEVTPEALLTANPELRKPRQQYDPSWVINGAIYAAWTDYWEENGGMYGPKTYGLQMSPEHSLDIDTEVDLRMARGLLCCTH